MKPYKHLLFDLDNTLMDFDRAERVAFAAAFSRVGFAFSDEKYALYHRINEGLWKQLERGEITRARLLDLRFEMLLERMGYPDVERSRTLSELYFYYLPKQRFLMDGAVDVCETLSRHYRMHLITNGAYEVQKGRFFGSPLEKYFEHAFISEKMGADKPSRLFFEMVMDEIGTSRAEEYCVIGDSLSSDIAGANAVGIDAIWVPKTPGRDTHRLSVIATLNSIRELPSFLLEGDREDS